MSAMVGDLNDRGLSVGYAANAIVGAVTPCVAGRLVLSLRVVAFRDSRNPRPPGVASALDDAPRRWNSGRPAAGSGRRVAVCRPAATRPDHRIWPVRDAGRVFRARSRLAPRREARPGSSISCAASSATRATPASPRRSGAASPRSQPPSPSSPGSTTTASHRRSATSTQRRGASTSATCSARLVARARPRSLDVSRPKTRSAARAATTRPRTAPARRREIAARARRSRRHRG